MLADGTLQEQSEDHFEQVFAPKVAGSWNLHRESKRLEIPLKYFVLFSYDIFDYLQYSQLRQPFRLIRSNL